jgi:hypothetical protein
MKKGIIEISFAEFGPEESGASGGTPVRLLARASRLPEAEGNVVQPEQHEVLVPLSAEPTRIPVSPGLWGVELALPSGSLSARHVRVSASESSRVEFNLSRSPREWLAWQRLEGTVPGADQYDNIHDRGGAGLKSVAAGVIPKERSRKLSSGDLDQLTRAAGGRIVSSDPFAWAQNHRLKNISQVTVLRSSSPVRHAKEEQRAGEAFARWRHLTRCALLEVRPDKFGDLGAARSELFEFFAQDNWYDVWRLEPRDFDANQERRFALVVTTRSIEFVSLPVPWSATATAPGGGLIELAIDKSPVARPFRTSVTVRDPEIFALLAYMKSGSLSRAARVAEAQPDHWVELLRDKQANPLAAAAAGYALLGATTAGARERWYPWLKNLCRWFPWLPDGAVLEGRRLLMSAKNGSEIAEARKHFELAFERGLPFFSQGLAWLLEGLRYFEAEDAELAKAAELVRVIALRSSPREVFTTLHPTARRE